MRYSTTDSKVDAIQTYLHKEIEVKLGLHTEQLDYLYKWLEENAEYQGTQEQKDYYFDNKAATFFYDTPQGTRDFRSFLRLRKIHNGDSYLTSKVRTFHATTHQIMDVHEYETKVDDGDMTVKILQGAGFDVDTVVHKHRKIYVSGQFEIAIDDVVDQGMFVEIELKNEEENTQQGIQCIHEFMKSIGITKCRSYSRGYLTIFKNLHFDFSEALEL